MAMEPKSHTTLSTVSTLVVATGLGVIFGSSAYRGSPLENLVEHYLTDALMQAVGREAASGGLRFRGLSPKAR